MLIFAGLAYAKQWETWGLFAGLCYSHQAGIVKSECCFTAATLWGIQTWAKTGLISLPLSVHFPPVFLATLAPLPPLPLSSPPQKSDLSPRQRSFEPILSFFYLTKNIRSGVWTASLSVISHVSQPFCTWTDRTMKAENWRTMWDQMFHLKFAASKKST